MGVGNAGGGKLLGGAEVMLAVDEAVVDAINVELPKFVGS